MIDGPAATIKRIPTFPIAEECTPIQAVRYLAYGLPPLSPKHEAIEGYGSLALSFGISASSDPRLVKAARQLVRLCSLGELTGYGTQIVGPNLKNEPHFESLLGNDLDRFRLMSRVVPPDRYAIRPDFWSQAIDWHAQILMAPDELEQGEYRINAYMHVVFKTVELMTCSGFTGSGVNAGDKMHRYGGVKMHQ